MLNACRQFLTDRLMALALQDTTHPFTDGTPTAPPPAPAPVKNIFFDELPLDFLKDNDYAVCCLPLQDRTKAYGKLIARPRTLTPAPSYALTRRRFTREILFRCRLYAKTAEELYGAGSYTGLVEQFSQGIAEHKIIAASDNSAIRIEPQDTARPWDSGVEMERKLRRPGQAIVRVLFTGGVQTVTALPIIPSVEIIPIVVNERLEIIQGETP